MKYKYRTWYLPLIAGFYALLGFANVLYLVSQHFRPGFMTSSRELFPLAATMFAWLYFYAPKWGHEGLIALTAAVILFIGESDPGATMFHFAVLVLLLLPFFTQRRRDIQKSGLAA